MIMSQGRNTGAGASADGQRTPKNMTGFWDFSLALYDQPGAEEACIQLQDEGHCDVNMVLFCIWFSLHCGYVPSTILQQAIGLSEEWGRRAVRPLRAIRRDLKDGVDRVAWRSVRDQIKMVELEAERAQQEALSALVVKPAPYPAPLDHTKAEAAFNQYASISGLTVRADTPAFQTLLACAARVDVGADGA